jgi:hypothetical protein
LAVGGGKRTSAVGVAAPTMKKEEERAQQGTQGRGGEMVWSLCRLGPGRTRKGAREDMRVVRADAFRAQI